MGKWILFLCVAACLAACEKENELTPSRADRDWYVIEDSDERVGHELFLLYKKYGLPVFVNDTIGREERGVDAYGNPVVYYNILNLDYTLGQTMTDATLLSKTTTLVKKEEECLAGIRFLDDCLIPMLPKALHVNSILLVDSLYETRRVGSWDSVKVDLKAVIGLTAMAVGQVPTIAALKEDKRMEYAAGILAELALKDVKKNTVALADFYKVSTNPTTNQPYYGVIGAAANPAMNSPYFETYGFLDCAIRYPEDHAFYYKTVSKEADLEDFVIACFQYKPEQFTERYAAYPLVLKKYEMMRAMLLQTVYMSE